MPVAGQDKLQEVIKTAPKYFNTYIAGNNIYDKGL
jgi:hypothetical protein